MIYMSTDVQYCIYVSKSTSLYASVVWPSLILILLSRFLLCLDGTVHKNERHGARRIRQNNFAVK